MSIVPIFTALVCFSPMARAGTGAMQVFTTESASGAKTLAESLFGTSWVYHYAGSDYPFRFGNGGQIEQFKFWPDVRWRVISPAEALLDRPDGSSVLLRFNRDATTFRCKDWDGKPATGSRAGGKTAGG